MIALDKNKNKAVADDLYIKIFTLPIWQIIWGVYILKFKIKYLKQYEYQFRYSFLLLTNHKIPEIHL